MIFENFRKLGHAILKAVNTAMYTNMMPIPSIFLIFFKTSCYHLFSPLLHPCIQHTYSLHCVMFDFFCGCRFAFKIAAIQPFFITMTRSQIPSTSSSSEDTTTTPFWFFTQSPMASYTSVFAPTSIPRVGSSKRNTSASVMIHRDNMTFCWFPPLKAETLWFGPFALVCSCCM